MKEIIIDFGLPPGPLSKNQLEKLLQLIINEFKWIQPDKYGVCDGDTKLNNTNLDDYLSFILDFYEKKMVFTLTKNKDYLIIFPDRNNEKTFYGHITLYLKNINETTSTKDYNKKDLIFKSSYIGILHSRKNRLAP